MRIRARQVGVGPFSPARVLDHPVIVTLALPALYRIDVGKDTYWALHDSRFLSMRVGPHPTRCGSSRFAREPRPLALMDRAEEAEELDGADR